MSAATVPEMALSSEVSDFLNDRNAKLAYANICEVIRKSYPDLLHLESSLQEDPDVDGRICCVIIIHLSPSASPDERQARWRRYHERLVDEIAFAERRLFGTITRYVMA